MTSPPPESEPHAFTLLAEGVQRQLYSMGWRELRAIQARAIRAFCATDADLLIMAETAGGKTEAAMFFVLADLMERPPSAVGALYLAPIKALLNNQAERLGTYTEMVGLRRFRDTQCGFKVFRGGVARQLFALGRVDRFMFDVEILFLAERAGLRLREMPATWADMPGSKVRFWEGVVNMFRDLWRIRRLHPGRIVLPPEPERHQPATQP